MKNLNQIVIASLSILLLMVVTSCNNSTAAQSQEVHLKKNEQLKERVFEQIMSDEELLTEFLNEMHEDRQAMEWMRGNQPMVQSVYGGNNMRNMMRQNPEMRQQMMQNMMEMMDNDTTMRPDPEMRRKMMQSMMRMMEQDTAMQNRMREMMQRHRMRENNN